MSEVTRREEIERNESKVLMSYACKASDSLGREYGESPDDYRTCFQRDRDRIIHTRAYRREQGKTQVFTTGENDHYRNRLTHTNEVQQISRDIARSLGLNEDLAEAIALAHDLGHTPFGHAGEEAMNEKMMSFGKHFEHNEQSLRIVELLESPYPEFEGLNLSAEVREGLAKHQTVYDQQGSLQKVNTLEAQVVNLADELAYNHHDLDDGLHSGLITINHDTLPQLPTIMREAVGQVLQKYGDTLPQKKFYKRVLTVILNVMIVDVITETRTRIQRLQLQKLDDVKKQSEVIVGFSPIMENKVRELRKFLYRNVYDSQQVKAGSEEGKRIVHALFDHYMEHPEELSIDDRDRISRGEAPEDVVKDFIAGMTDRFAIEQYRKLGRTVKAIQLTLLGE